MRKVENGSGLVNASAQTLNDTVASLKRITGIAGESAAASQERAAGVDQVAKAMSQMEQVTQSNSAQTEEMSSTAEELSTTAAGLQNLFTQFELTAAASRKSAQARPRSATPKLSPRSKPETWAPGNMWLSPWACIDSGFISVTGQTIARILDIDQFLDEAEIASAKLFARDINEH